MALQNSWQETHLETPTSTKYQLLNLSDALAPPVQDTMSRQVMISLLKPPYRSILSSDVLHELPLKPPSLFHRRLAPPPTRHFSSSTPTAAKPIVLEQPDKFRPPSHPARLNARRVPRHYPGPPIPAAEKAAQATRKYPHTFPSEGTRMHWFLTNKWVHLWISLVCLYLSS
jgi:hypothetical protein